MVLDAITRTVARAATAAGPSPSGRALAPLRATAMRRALASRRRAADACARRLQAGDLRARGELALLAEEALRSMRAQVHRAARRAGLLARLCALGDRWWGGCRAEELLDDPDLDLGQRTRIMQALDAFNGTVQSYERFFDALLPLARPDGPTRVLDLAAGHGGFALAAARCARRRNLEFCFTASDLKREYLDLGAAIAERESLPVAFVVQDALDLSNLASGAYDIVVCTQSLHHFPPGLVAVMFEAATRVASRGVMMVDPCRSVLIGAGVALYGTLRHRSLPFAHDAWISLRKSYVPEELELLARIGSWGDRVESAWIPPGFCLLRART